MWLLQITQRQSWRCCLCQQAFSSSSWVDRVEFTRSVGQLGWWCVSSCLSIKHRSEHLQWDSSIVAVNCVHVGDGDEQGGEHRGQRWIHYRCQFMETYQCKLCHSAVSSVDWLDELIMHTRKQIHSRLISKEVANVHCIWTIQQTWRKFIWDFKSNTLSISLEI